MSTSYDIIHAGEMAEMADAYNSDQKWNQRIVGHDTVDPESLLANPLNFRIHTGFTGLKVPVFPFLGEK